MKRALLLTLILSIATLGFSQNEEARYNYIRKSITRNADGSTDYRSAFSLTLFTHTAMNSTYGESFVAFNPQFQTVTINDAYTIRKNGKRIDLPANALVEVLPSYAAGAADFNYLKEWVIVHTGLDLGSTIYLDYSIHTKPGFNKHLDYNFVVDESSPISEYSLTIALPEGQALHQALYNPEGQVAAASDVKANGQRTINYSIKNIPAHSREGFQTTDLTRQWRFLCTTSDFETEMRELFYATPDPDIAAWGKEQVKTEPNVMKRLRAARQYVARQFKVVPVPLKEVGSIRPFAQIKQGAYITAYEQAAVLQQMLKACNIQADVQATFAPSLPKEFRTLNNAEKFLVTQQLGDSPVLISPDNDARPTSAPLVVGLSGEQANPAKPINIYKEYTATIAAANLNGEGSYLYSLPADGAAVNGWRMQTLPTLRETVFEIPAVVDETHTYTIKTDGQVKLAGSYTTNLSGPDGALLSETLSQAADGTITLVRRIALTRKTYTLQEYPAIRSIITTWLSPSHQKLLFVKK